MSDLRDAQIEAAREALGWELEPMGEYADNAVEVLGEIVDAVMAVLNDTVEDAMNPGRAAAVASRDLDLFAMPGGGVLRTHPASACEGGPCCIHSPSGHHMRDWPLNWRADRGIMERLCQCGIGHDDPDDRAYRSRIGREASGVHGCCGHCVAPS